MDTFEKRSHYFRELSLCLQRNGFTTQNNLEQMLSVEWEDRPLAASIASICVRDSRFDLEEIRAERLRQSFGNFGSHPGT